MLRLIKQTMSKSIWHLLATILVILIAGPEVLMSLELMTMVELLGASTFVLMYFSGIRLFISNIWQKFIKFERYSVFYLPSFIHLKQMPGLLVHFVPERTVCLSILGLVLFLYTYFYSSLLV